MKKRYLYALLFGMPGIAISAFVSFFVMGAVTGVFWLFIFGDSEWPSIAGAIIPAVLILTFLLLWLTSIVIGYRTGKKLEKDSDFNKIHVAVSVGLTIVPVILFALYQLSVGNFGPKPDTLVCYDYCIENGYTTYGTPFGDAGEPNCVCFEEDIEVLRVKLDKIVSDK